MLGPLWHYGGMIPRSNLAPNNRRNVPLDELLSIQFVTPKFPKSIETPSVKTWDTPGRGQQGESVTGGSNKSKIIRKGTTRAT